MYLGYRGVPCRRAGLSAGPRMILRRMRFPIACKNHIHHRSEFGFIRTNRERPITEERPRRAASSYARRDWRLIRNCSSPVLSGVWRYLRIIYQGFKAEIDGCALYKEGDGGLDARDDAYPGNLPSSSICLASGPTESGARRGPPHPRMGPNLRFTTHAFPRLILVGLKNLIGA